LADCTGHLGVYYNGRFLVITPNEGGYFGPVELREQEKLGKQAKTPPTLLSAS
jgi:hypothetical protein